MHKIYKLISNIPKGRVTTYKEIAMAINTKAYRWVGQVLKKNPYAPRIPCHRVVCSNGFIGGFATGTEKKIELLEKEGIIIKNNKIVDFEKKLFKLK
ncbi:MGMT family protein [Candidatus Woesearchaeota archaeon]|nr:MGMT family protein [Candidatus Woesearchaeota archaeon]